MTWGIALGLDRPVAGSEMRLRPRKSIYALTLPAPVHRHGRGSCECRLRNERGFLALVATGVGGDGLERLAKPLDLMKCPPFALVLPFIPRHDLTFEYGGGRWLQGGG